MKQQIKLLIFLIAIFLISAMSLQAQIETRAKKIETPMFKIPISDLFILASNLRSPVIKDYYYPAYKIFKTPSSRTQERYYNVELERLTYIKGSHVTNVLVHRIESGYVVTETRKARLYDVYIRFNSGNELSFTAYVVSNHDSNLSTSTYLFLNEVENNIEVIGKYTEVLDHDVN